jgi:hypothetical protein
MKERKSEEESLEQETRQFDDRGSCFPLRESCLPKKKGSSWMRMQETCLVERLPPPVDVVGQGCLGFREEFLTSSERKQEKSWEILCCRGCCSCYYCRSVEGTSRSSLQHNTSRVLDDEIQRKIEKQVFSSSNLFELKPFSVSEKESPGSLSSREQQTQMKSSLSLRLSIRTNGGLTLAENSGQEQSQEP